MKRLKQPGRMLIFIFSLPVIWVNCTRPIDNEYKIIETILNDKNNFYYLDLENYPEDNSILPIGVFDSGTGGLTVLEAIIQSDQYDNDTHSAVIGGDG